MPVIPQQHEIAPGLEDSPELCQRLVSVKPVGRLCGRDHVDGMSCERSCLGGSVNAGEIGKACTIPFSRTPHRSVWLNRHHAVAIFKEQTRKNSGSRRDINDQRFRPQPAFLLEDGYDLFRIARAKAHVVLHPGREALGRNLPQHGVYYTTEAAAMCAATGDLIN